MAQNRSRPTNRPLLPIIGQFRRNFAHLDPKSVILALHRPLLREIGHLDPKPDYFQLQTIFFLDLTGLTLNFVRNLISIDDPELAQVIVICYADSGMARLIQYIASAADLDEWHLHATEIFSGLLKDTTPKSISHVDPQKDALKHCSFLRPCLSIQETKVEVSHMRL